MAEVVGRRPVTPEPWVQYQFSACDICGGKRGI